MDIETNIDNTSYYKYGEKTIKLKNQDLWKRIVNFLPKVDMKFKERFFLFENDLEPPRCECGSDLKFVDMRTGFREFCSKKCMSNSNRIKESRKKTCEIKYGVDNPSKSELIKDKVKDTNIKNYGVEYPMMSKDIIDQNKKYFIDKYGVDNPSKVPEIRRRAEKTTMDRYGDIHAMNNDKIKSNLKSYFMDKYGVDNPSKVPEVREKSRKTTLLNHGVEYPLQNVNIMDKYKKSNLEKHGNEFYTKTDKYKKQIKESTISKNMDLIEGLVNIDSTDLLILCRHCNKEFTIQRQLWRKRESCGDRICLNCNPITNSVSKGEKSVSEYIRSIYDGEVIENHRIENKEIDIFIPKYKIGFEYNGLYWHSELNKTKKYHIDKTKFFENLGISIIHIWEDDWEYKKEIVKSIISNKILKSDRIFARKCSISEVNNRDVRNFLNKNHIQGFVGSKIKIGLFHKNELVSLMTFGGLRKSLGQKSDTNSYEMIRFCNVLNTSVVGGASKLIKFFIRKYNPKSIISYSDRSRGVGRLYNKIGFSSIKETDINYYWCINGVRYHRFNFRKDKLVSQGFDESKTEVEIMHSRGYFRVFDCGSNKWVKGLF